MLPWEARGRKLRLHKYFYSASQREDPWESHYSFFQDECRHSATIPADYLREVLMKHLPSRLTFSHQERLARMKEFGDGVPPKTVSKFVDRLARLIAAFSGGVFPHCTNDNHDAAPFGDKESGHSVRGGGGFCVSIIVWNPSFQY